MNTSMHSYMYAKFHMYVYADSWVQGTISLLIICYSKDN